MMVPGRASAQRPMGTDVSGYQPSINWTTVKNAGVSFAWTKATEGTSYRNPYFEAQEWGATNVGIYIGAYHFARPASNPNLTGANSADSEAAFFWSVAGNYVRGGGAFLVPMLDWEDTNLKTTVMTTSQASQWVLEWCNTVSNYARAAGFSNVCPVVYTGVWFSQPGSTYPGLDSTVTGLPSWIAAYPYCDGSGHCGTPNPQVGGPSSSYPWSTWNIWQYGNTNWSGGDSDVFNGTMAQFLALFQVTGTPVIPSFTYYWDPAGMNAPPGSGGGGNWDGSTSAWWVTGSSDTSWPLAGADAIFAGTPATVTLTASRSASSLTFSNGGYTIAGSQNLWLNGPGNIVIPSGGTVAIQCVLRGAAFNLSGGGTLHLSNGGNDSAGENVIGPNTVLQVDNQHDTGNTSTTLNLEYGGTYQDLDSTSGDQFLLQGCAIALINGGGILDNPNGNLTLTNWITGSGSLTYKGGSGKTLTITDTANNYSGGTIVLGPGTLKANAAHTLGSTSGALTVSGGTLNLNSASHTVGAVTISGGTISSGTLTGSSYAAQGGTVSAVLAGSAGLTKTTTSTCTLSGANTYSGITTISGGLLQISADNNLGTPPGSPVANKIKLNNGGISSGLRCSASFPLNANRGITLVGPNGGSIHATSGQTVTFPMVITGNGSLGIGASSTLGYGVSILSGANNYSGSTTIAAGTLRLGANGTLPAGTPLTIAPDNNGTSGGGVLDLNGYNQTIGPLATSSGIGGGGANTPTINLTGALTVLQTNTSTVFAGVITGSGGSLTLNVPSGGIPGVLTLSGTNTYTGNTIISAGTLALGATGSISNTANISIAAGATFDVSAIPGYVLGSTITLSAAGTATPAILNGGSSVDLGSQPIVLTYDGSDPALTISQGVLSLNGNPFTVNGSPLPPGVYTLIQQASGDILASGPFTVTGTAVPSASVSASISVTGGNVLLTVTDLTTTTLGPLSPSTYGQLVTFTATVAPAPTGGTVQFYDNGAGLGGPVALIGGTAAFSTNTLSVGSHPITAAFSGSAGYAPSATSGPSIQEVDLPPNSIPVTITNVGLLVDGSVQMNFMGVPGYIYLIQAATNLNPPVTWTTLSTNTADINGAFSFSDSSGSSNYNARFYRTEVQ